MKRENGHSLTHRFSSDERFDERMLSVYRYGFHYIKSPIHQFIGFSSLIKSAGKATEVSIVIRRLAGRTSVLPTDKGKPTPLAKRKRQPMSADITANTAAGFWEQKP